MAIGTPALAVANPTGGTTSVTTASFTPTANSTLIALIGSKGSSVSAAPTISDSLGGTWTKIGDFNDTTDSVHIYSSLYYQTVGASPSAMTVTAGSGTTATICSVMSITGIGTTFTNNISATSSSGAPSATLPSAPASTSAVLAWYQAHLTNAVTQPSGFTEVFDSTLASNYRAEFSYELPTSPSQSGSWAGGTNTSSVGILLEVTDASAGGGTTYNDTISESTTTGSGIANAMTFAPTLTESVTAADSDTSTATFPNALSESVTAADTQTAVAQFANTLSESWVADFWLSSSIGSGTTYNDTLAYSISAADAYSAEQISVPIVYPTPPPVGWVKTTPGTSPWTAADLARGTQWNSKAKGPSTW